MLGYWVPGGEGRNHKMPPAARGKMPANQLDVDKVLLTRTFNEWVEGGGDKSKGCWAFNEWVKSCMEGRWSRPTEQGQESHQLSL